MLERRTMYDRADTAWYTACRWPGSSCLLVLFSMVAGFLFMLNPVARAAGSDTIPFVETFEDSPASMANNTALPLHDQNNWTVASTNAGAVQTSVVFGGSKAGSMQNGELSHTFTNSTATNVWVDFYVRAPHAHLVSEPAMTTGLVCEFYVDESAHIVGTSGNSWITNASYQVSSNNWTRLTVNIDYASSNWSLYAAGDVENDLAQQIFTNLPFNTDAPTNTYFNTFSMHAMKPAETVYLDSFSVGGPPEGPPANIDNDVDGMSDRWEIDRFGSVAYTNDFSGDTDSDGITDLNEFIAGTDPTNSASYLRIVNVDLESAASSNVVVTWEGGGYSVTSVYAGDTVSRVYSLKASSESYEASDILVAAVAEGSVSETTNVWVDTGAATDHGSRFYNVILADYAGLSATNAQDWAMFSQDRAASSKYMICVPVNYGGTNNNLNAKLGSHLARGLHGSDTVSQADKLIIKNPVTGVDVEYYLSASGVWRSNDVAQGIADVDLGPGTAMWVQRLSGSVARPNTVFAGEVWKSDTVSNITIYAQTGSSNGWTMVGWSMANSKSVSGSDTSSNQLGFYAAGAKGALTGDWGSPGELGDMICIWRNGHWRYMWMIDGAGAGYNGRWWDELGWKWMDWTFKPGDAFYYYHPTNNPAAADFNWTPTP